MSGTQTLLKQQWIGNRLGKYEITEILGVGGKGVVFRAHDTSIERDVAIKVLTEQLSGDELQQARFLAEAKSAGKFNHNNTVTIHAVSPDGETIWEKNVGNPVRSAGTIGSPNRLIFGLDNGTLVGLQCSSRSLASSTWPKYMGNLQNR